MFIIDSIWRDKTALALNSLAKELNIQLNVSKDNITPELPPKPEMGDIGFPLFSFAKQLKTSPAVIAAKTAETLSKDAELSRLGKISALGPYINILLNRGEFAKKVLTSSKKDKENSAGLPLSGKRITVEFSSPNTNKPLHLGHLRNDVLGESLSRILKAAGADVRKVCIINDRGIHICKSMLAYKELKNGATPESEGVKSDFFVGDCYVKFHKLSETDKNAEERAQELLRKWEAGDAETIALWKKMNEWAVSGIKKTYDRTGVSFDKFYFESETYLLGKDKIEEGLSKGIFYRDTDGSVWIDLEAENLGKKAVLRKDGTSLYVTQDIGTAISRHKDWPFDRLIYVVGSEQIYHFQVLFSILKKFGYSWAEYLFHLAYGMVNLPEGKMKSREGTVVDADNLIDELKEMALSEIRAKEREKALGKPEETAEKIAIGALHYYLQQASLQKDMLFNSKESLSFNGNTGPYLQYMGARISSMLRKNENEYSENEIDFTLLNGDAEWELIKTIAGCKSAVYEAAQKYDSSVIASYCYELAKAFSRFYHECQVINCENAALSKARILLSKAALSALKEALYLICVPFLEAM